MVADHPEVLGNVDHRDRQGRRGHTLAHPPAQGEGGNDRQQEAREGIHGVGDHHEDPVEPPSRVAGNQAQRHADAHGDQRRGDHDLEGQPGTEDHPGEYVVPKVRRAEEVPRGRCLELREPLELRLPVGCQERGGEGQDDEQEGDHRPRDDDVPRRRVGRPPQRPQFLGAAAHRPYLILGSTQADTTSMSRLTATTNRA